MMGLHITNDVSNARHADYIRNVILTRRAQDFETKKQPIIVRVLLIIDIFIVIIRLVVARYLYF